MSDLATLQVHSRIHDYELRFQPDLKFLERILATPNALFVIDANVWKLHPDSPLRKIDPAAVLLLEATEENKTFEGATRVYDALLSRSAKRNATIVSIGGGIVQDVTGFAASTLYRGVRWIFLPTTLLAQADSCIGAKTSLNFRRYKNLLGSFYPPHEIHLAPSFLDTLPRDDFFSGLGEVIKLHLMGGAAIAEQLDAELPRLLQRESIPTLQAIRRSLAVKISWFEGDEFDSGRRNLLNYGHDFGHALESTSGFAIPHGQAVLAGMIFANRVARARKLLSSAKCDALEKTMLSAWVVRPLRAHLDGEKILDAMKKDKKRTGAGLALILMEDGFRMSKVDDLSEGELAAATAEIADLVEHK